MAEESLGARLYRELRTIASVANREAFINRDRLGMEAFIAETERSLAEVNEILSEDAVLIYCTILDGLFADQETTEPWGAVHLLMEAADRVRANLPALK